MSQSCSVGSESLQHYRSWTFPEQEVDQKGDEGCATFVFPKTTLPSSDVHDIEQRLSHAHTALKLHPLPSNLGH